MKLFFWEPWLLFWLALFACFMIGKKENSMEIITRGNPPAEKTWIGNCRDCGTVARAKQSELSPISYDYRMGNDPFVWEHCLVCQTEKKGNPKMLFREEKKDVLQKQDPERL